MNTYKILQGKNLVDGSLQIVAIIKNDIWSIPLDPANTDYQQYLKWLDDGNTPLPADEGVN